MRVVSPLPLLAAVGELMSETIATVIHNRDSGLDFSSKWSTFSKWRMGENNEWREAAVRDSRGKPCASHPHTLGDRTLWLPANISSAPKSAVAKCKIDQPIRIEPEFQRVLLRWPPPRA